MISRVDTDLQKRGYPSLHQSQVLIPCFLVVSLIWISFSVIAIATMALGRYSVSPVNPFSAYADIIPGQSESAILSTEFSCDFQLYDNPLEKACRLSPVIGTFSQINVTISNQVVHQITFILRDTTLRVGDMVLFLGTMDFRIVHNAIYFSWHGNLAIASITSNNEHCSPFLFVWQVALTDMTYVSEIESNE
jgi:hypothetical protein